MIIRPHERDATFRHDLRAFAWKAFEVNNPGSSWRDNWHLETITDRLSRVANGQSKRLIINLPPRSLKSHLGSVALPAHLLGKDPGRKIVCISYSQDLANKHASDCRRLIESDFYRNLYPHVRLIKSTENLLETDRGGFRKATSVGGSITGLGGSLIIIDDPLNAGDAHSKPRRDTANDWYFSSVVSRLDSPNTDAIILIMQRLHEDDLAGRLIERGGWDVLLLPAIAPDDIKIQLPNGRAHEWKKGEALHEAQASLDHLDEQKRQMGTYIFSAQYLQTPLPEGGKLLKRDWLKYYESPPARQSQDQIVLSLDTASKATSSSAYSVCLVFLVRNKNEYYLIDVWRDQPEFPELVKQVRTFSQRHQANAVLIEEHASGIPLIQALRHSGLQGMIGIKVQTDKVTRMYGATPKLEAGSLILPRCAPWLDDFLVEYLAFPGGRHDDQMDALSQFLNWRANKEDSFFEFDFGYHEEPGAPDPDEILWKFRR